MTEYKIKHGLALSLLVSLLAQSTGQVQSGPQPVGISTSAASAPSQPTCFPAPAFLILPPPVVMNEAYFTASVPTSSWSTSTFTSSIDPAKLTLSASRIVCTDDGCAVQQTPSDAGTKPDDDIDEVADLDKAIDELFQANQKGSDKPTRKLPEKLTTPETTVEPPVEIVTDKTDKPAEPKEKEEPAKNTPTADEYFTKAIEFAKAGDGYGAKTQLLAAIECDPKKPEYHLELGVLYRKSGAYSESLASLERSAQLKPNQPEYLYQKSLTQLQSKQPAEALKNLNQLIAIEPKSIRALYLRTLVNLKLKNYKEAVQCAQKASEQAPNDPKVLHLLGTALALNNDHRAAVEPLKKSIRLEPESEKSHTSLLAAYAQIGELAKAIDECTWLLSRPNFDDSLYMWRAECHFALGQFAPAAEDYTHYLVDHPHSKQALLKRGSANVELGRYQEAHADFTAILKQQPQNIDALYRRCFADLVLNSPVQAAADGEAGIASAGWSKSESAYFSICAYLAYTQLKQTDKAQKVLANALGHYPPTKWPYPILEFFNKSSTNQATTTDREALVAGASTDKEQTEAHAYIGLYLAWTGQESAATKYLTWAQSKGQPGIPEYMLAINQLKK